LHTPFVLPAGAGSLALSRLQLSSVRPLDYLTYTNLSPNRSYGSLPDGQSFDRQDFFYVTPGGTNDGRSAPLTVVINEWQAVNNSTVTNPVSGKFSDWFELYNYGTNPANLAGYFLTDVLTNKFKYRIPFGYVIPPGGFLLCWADDRNTNGTPEPHVSFKMNASGESLGLFGADGAPVDFVNYGPQTNDVSEGRYPDGAMTLFTMPTATPRTNNLIPNTAPVLPPILDQFLHVGQTLQLAVKAIDAESLVQTLTFSLDPGAPPSAYIIPETGYLTWTANVAAPSTNSFTVRVTDNGIPLATATTSFLATVLPPPTINGISVNATLLTVSFTTVPGQLYHLQYKERLDDSVWIDLGFPLTGTGGDLQIFDDITGQTQRFYRVLVTSPE
jgi:hypothetical protein